MPNYAWPAPCLKTATTRPFLQVGRIIPEQKQAYLKLVSLAGQISSVRSEKVTVMGLSVRFQAT